MTIKGNKLKKIGLVLAVVFGLALMSTGERVYAEASISISNSANLISFGNVKPGTSGSVATASDELTITTECSAGSNVYISATNDSDTGTNLVNHGASSNNTISALTGTTIGTTAKALENNTWGFNTDNSATSSGANNGNGVYYGLPTYEDATSKAIYAGTNTTVPIYYGAKVTNTLTPGTYVGSVLYTAVVNKTCNEYTLKFNTNSATASTLVDQTHTVDEQINLANISSTSVISRTGYHLTGWKDQDNNDYGITGTADVNPNDTTPVTLTAQWAPNTYTIAYAGNGNTGGSTSSQTDQAYNTSVTLRSNGFSRTNYDFLGWSLSNTATSASYSANTSYNVSTLATAANVQNTDGATITLYAVWKIRSHTVSITSGTGISSTTGAGTYNVGATVNISATPSANYNFSSWTVNSGGASLASTTSSSTSFTMPDANVTITANGVLAVQNCSASVHPTTSTGCKMADGKTWALGYNGNSAAWTAMFNVGSGSYPREGTLKSSSYCPSSDYSAAKYSDYQALLSAQGTGSQLYTALGLSGARYFWSSTEGGSNYAYYLLVRSSSAGTSGSNKSDAYYLLCVK